MTDAVQPTASRPLVDDDQLWLSVMNKMDETWAELVGQQVELERKNAELEGAHAFMAGVFDSMSDVLVACDTALRVVRTNQAAERLFPASADGLVGRLLAELVDPCSPTTAADVANTIVRRQRLEDREFILAAAGGPMPFAVNGTVLYDGRGARQAWFWRHGRWANCAAPIPNWTVRIAV
ncbi:PAS domain-containing protein [Gluconacetobacter asukensis]|uniref:PAS domain-containing protein n=1 Tax=Gluconacetobacter asukensis TaxID=1017181 RepID=UPI001C8227D3|nr:PAS domain-containing protein [Gluconacetobacter asukensis]